MLGGAVDVYQAASYRHPSPGRGCPRARYRTVIADAELGKFGCLHSSERARAARTGAVEVDSHRLERTVRAAATASLDEGEFVRRLRRGGVLIRPRFAAGAMTLWPGTPLLRGLPTEISPSGSGVAGSPVTRVGRSN